MLKVKHWINWYDVWLCIIESLTMTFASDVTWAITVSTEFTFHKSLLTFFWSIMFSVSVPQWSFPQNKLVACVLSWEAVSGRLFPLISVSPFLWNFSQATGIPPPPPPPPPLFNQSGLSHVCSSLHQRTNPYMVCVKTRCLLPCIIMHKSIMSRKTVHIASFQSELATVRKWRYG